MHILRIVLKPESLYIVKSLNRCLLYMSYESCRPHGQNALCSWLRLVSQLAAVVSHIYRLNVFFLFVDMARGQQKIQSQQKNAKKQAEQKKKQGHDQKAAAKAALIYTCTVCRVRGTENKIPLYAGLSPSLE